MAAPASGGPGAAPVDTAGAPDGARPVAPGPWQVLASPVAPYYLLLGATLSLVAIGLIMVLSSSSVDSLQTSDSAYTYFYQQLVFAILGFPVAAVAMRIPTGVYKRLAGVGLVGSLLSLCLVFTSLGLEVNGNRNWLEIGQITMQPSELAKLMFVLWGASVLSRKRRRLDDFVEMLVPLVPGAVLLVGLVLLGNDLGTAMVVAMIMISLWVVAGARPRHVLAVVLPAAAMVYLLVVTSSNRLKRISVWWEGCTDVSDAYGFCYQSVHGAYALATGGWWGVGLGASRQKWDKLPMAANDFIFAVLGEELGLAGSLLVLALYGVLLYALVRIVLASPDPFVQIATAGTAAWIGGQTIVNIGTVVGLMPVIGVPLPLISSGGSALITTMIAVGVMLGFARRLPGVPEAMRARPDVVRRSLAVLPGRGADGRRNGVVR